jgi:dihydrofolate reductase
VRKLVYFVASTMDGFVAPPDRSDPSGPEGIFGLEGDHLEAIFSEWADIIPVQARRALDIDPPNQRFDTVLEGRVSYQLALDAGITDAYPHLRHLVFSRTLSASPDPNVEIVAGDPIARVRQLKAEPGKDIWLVGGGNLAHGLLPEIDRIVLKLNPVVIGSGTPLFDGEFDAHRFALTDSHVYDSGVVFLTYDRR